MTADPGQRLAAVTLKLSALSDFPWLMVSTVPVAGLY
jgi:hypothetical protein